MNGYYRRQSPRHRNFPVYLKRVLSENQTVFQLFYNLEQKRWNISPTDYHEGDRYPFNIEKGVPTPTKNWKVPTSKSYTVDHGFRIIPLNPFYPKVFQVTYGGIDEEILQVLKNKKLS